MSTEDKGKAPMKATNEEKLMKEFENIIIDINEYCEPVDEKIKLIEEIAIDLRADLEKAREISIHFFRIIKELKENFSKHTLKSPKLNFRTIFSIHRQLRKTLQTLPSKKRTRSMN